MFYNVENLFDIVNDSLIFDDERTPKGRSRWTQKRYALKIRRIAEVISKVGSDFTGTSPDLIGLCEVENYKVLKDLVEHPNLQKEDYGILHFDSPDERGIDVALLYKKQSFIPESFSSRRLLLFSEEGLRDYSRDQLVVGGWLDGENIYVIVNHWPSRSGGELRSWPHRKAAALLNRRIIDSLRRLESNPKIISMGDFNDNPTDKSIKKILLRNNAQREGEAPVLFNPMEALYKKGLGTHAYRDEWSLFDQIICTTNFLDRDFRSYSFWKVGIYDASFLVVQSGRWEGYPFRTYVSGVYTGGYSDHFPVYAFFIKRVN